MVQLSVENADNAYVCLIKGTSDVQAAALEEEINGLELADLKQEIEEEREADLEAAALDAQAREGQQLQEEAHLAKERMVKERRRRRCLKKLEKEVQIASLVKFYLSEADDEEPLTKSIPAMPSKLLLPSLTVQQPPSVPVSTNQHPPIQLPVAAQVQANLRQFTPHLVMPHHHPTRQECNRRNENRCYD
ncbi:hypothetical protein GOODEAATRI_017243 [Goodea atripinnis]|uniref:Uncharacterized protein n=1 Tax=Goodea atripinnis TaxID=208336 RepID=A0ABV0NXW4_9TELE